jgi:uncharacterized protein with HEPN domain
MRRRDQRVALSGALEAAEAITRFVDGRSFADYEADPILSAAVERKFEIIGEALSSAVQADPALELRLPEARKAIGFRNVLAHDYEDVAASVVWSTAIEDVPRLTEKLRLLIGEREPS